MEENKSMEQGRVSPIVLMLGVLAVAAVVLLLVFFRSKPLVPGKNDIPADGISAYLPSGIIQESATKILESYVYVPENAADKVAAYSYTSTLSMEENLAKYSDYLKSNGWTITYEAKADEATPHFYAVKDKTEVNITFSRTLGGVKVSVAYSGGV